MKKIIKRIKLKTYIGLVLILLLLPIIILGLYKPSESQAEWYDEGYAYRQRFTFTHNADITTDRKVTFTLDTAELIADGVMQADCDDTRFTGIDGEVYQYDLTGTCDNGSTTYEVVFPQIFNAVNAAYVYYGNPSAINNEIDSTGVTDVTLSGGDPTAITTRTNEEFSPGPVGWWKFDEGVDNTCADGADDSCDSSASANDGLMTASDWQAEDLCVNGKCMFFDGSTAVSTVTDANNISLDDGLLAGFTFETWVRVISDGELSTGEIFDKGSTTYCRTDTEASGAVDLECSLNLNDATGTNATLNLTGALTLNKWHHIAIGWTEDGDDEITIYVDGINQGSSTDGDNTGGFDADANDLLIGGSSTTNYHGFIDDFKVYNFEKTAAQVKADFLARGGAGKGSGAVLGAQSTAFLNDGLVGYWSLDEVSGTSAAEDSGNTNTGTLINAQEAGTATNDANTTTTVLRDDGGSTDLTSVDDAYNGMVLYITDDAACGLSADEQRTITDYDGTNLDITVGVAFSVDLDLCDYTIRHQIPGKFGRAVEFDGANDADDGNSVIQATTVEMATNESRSVSVWFKADATSDNNWNGIVSPMEHNLSSLQFLGATLQLSIRPCKGIDDSGILTDSTDIDRGVWTHVVYGYDVKTDKIFYYRDGALTEEKSLSGVDCDAWTSGNNLIIGGISNNASGEKSFDGAVDEVRIYNRSLSAGEVKDLYNWAPGPVGYWPMDENTGTSTTYDRSINAANGTLTSITENSWAPGKYGSALNLDGSADFVDVGTGPSVVNTVTFWAYPETTTEYFVNLTSTTDYIAASSGTLTPTGFTSPSVYVDGVYQGATGTIVANKWQHIAVTTATAENASNLDLGRTADANYLQGKIDDVRIYNYARTPGQIIEDMNADHPLGGSPVGSQTIYWKFDEQYGTTAYDTVGNENGTVDSGLAWATSANCKINGCLQWSSATEEVLITDANDDDINFNGSEPFSGSAWIYVTTMPGSSDEDAVIAKWDATVAAEKRAYRMYITNGDADTDGDLNVQLYDESANQAITVSTTDDPLAVNTWHHVVWGFNGGVAGAAGDLELYIDGRNVGENAANASFLGVEDVATDFTVGEYDPTDGVTANTFFTGYIDEVKMYSSELTMDEVGLDMNANAAINFSTGQVEADQLTDTAGTAPSLIWNLDENTGTTANDTSGNGYSGTITNMADTDWVPGFYGSALDFDGSNDHVTIADTADLDFAGGDSFTIQTWFKHDTASALEVIVAKYDTDASDGGYKIQMESDGDITCGIDNDNASFPSDSVTSTAATYDDNTWHYASCVKNGSTSLTLYIDGVSVGTPDTSITASTLANNEAFYYGSDHGGATSNYTGQLDHLTITRAVRTQAQVAYDYNRGRPVGHWQLDECQGTTAYDASGNGNNGTITIGATSDYTSIGTCGSGTGTEAWNAGTTGKRNASLGLDGTDDYVTVTDTTELQLGTGDFTISMWIFPDKVNYTASDQGTIISKDFTGFELFIYIFVLRAYVGGTSNNIIGDKVLSITQWQHVVLRRTGSTIETFVNGQFDGSATNSASASNAGTDITIGDRTGSGVLEYDGLIDDVRIYNYALSATQIQKIINDDAGARFGPDSGSP